MDKSSVLAFPKNGNLWITKNYRGITLALAAKVLNALLLNNIWPEEIFFTKSEYLFKKPLNSFLDSDNLSKENM